MKIEFMSKKLAERLHPTNNACMISMGDPGEHIRLIPWENRIRIECDDLDPEELESIGRQDLIRTARFFNEADANKIIDFVNVLDESIDTIYVHCNHGVSRSSAVANFLAERFGTTATSSSRRINPNPLIYNTLKKVNEEK